MYVCICMRIFIYVAACVCLSVSLFGGRENALWVMVRYWLKQFLIAKDSIFGLKWIKCFVCFLFLFFCLFLICYKGNACDFKFGFKIAFTFW